MTANAEPRLLVTVLFAVPMTANAEPRSSTIGVAASITPSAEGGIGTVFPDAGTR
jgi:hypothetical protein